MLLIVIDVVVSIKEPLPVGMVESVMVWPQARAKKLKRTIAGEPLILGPNQYAIDVKFLGKEFYILWSYRLTFRI